MLHKSKSGGYKFRCDGISYRTKDRWDNEGWNWYWRKCMCKEHQHESSWICLCVKTFLSCQFFQVASSYMLASCKNCAIEWPSQPTLICKQYRISDWNHLMEMIVQDASTFKVFKALIQNIFKKVFWLSCFYNWYIPVCNCAFCAANFLVYRRWHKSASLLCACVRTLWLSGFKSARKYSLSAIQQRTLDLTVSLPWKKLKFIMPGKFLLNIFMFWNYLESVY